MCANRPHTRARRHVSRHVCRHMYRCQLRAVHRAGAARSRCPCTCPCACLYTCLDTCLDTRVSAHRQQIDLELRQARADRQFLPTSIHMCIHMSITHVYTHVYAHVHTQHIDCEPHQLVPIVNFTRIWTYPAQSRQASAAGLRYKVMAYIVMAAVSACKCRRA